LAVAAVFVEQGESAKTTDRTKLLELLDYCREKTGDKIWRNAQIRDRADQRQFHRQANGEHPFRLRSI
jgi:hypothetical protein